MQLVDKRRCNADEIGIVRLILRNSASCSRDDKYDSVPYIKYSVEPQQANRGEEDMASANLTSGKLQLQKLIRELPK